MLVQTCDSKQNLLYTISLLYTLLNEQILLLALIKEPLFLGMNGVKPNMNGKPWEGKVPAQGCWMCSLSWGIQLMFLLLDAVKTNDVFLMLFFTCCVPLKITKQNPSLSINWKPGLKSQLEPTRSWLLVQILLM